MKKGVGDTIGRTSTGYLLIGEMKQAAERDVDTQVVGALSGQGRLEVADDLAERVASRDASHTLPRHLLVAVLLQKGFVTGSLKRGS